MRQHMTGLHSLHRGLKPHVINRGPVVDSLFRIVTFIMLLGLVLLLAPMPYYFLAMPRQLLLNSEL